MVGESEWDYSYAIDVGEDRDMNLKGQFGYALNHGSTEWAIDEILYQWDDVSKLVLRVLVHLHRRAKFC